jgi:hypothetical protein
MIEKRGRFYGGRSAPAVLNQERQRGRRSGGRQQWSEIQAVAAKLMTCLRLLIRRILWRRPVGIGMRDRTQLGNE